MVLPIAPGIAYTVLAAAATALPFNLIVSLLTPNPSSTPPPVFGACRYFPPGTYFASSGQNKLCPVGGFFVHDPTSSLPHAECPAGQSTLITALTSNLTAASVSSFAALFSGSWGALYTVLANGDTSKLQVCTQTIQSLFCDSLVPTCNSDCHLLAPCKSLCKKAQEDCSHVYSKLVDTAQLFSSVDAFGITIEGITGLDAQEVDILAFFLRSLGTCSSPTEHSLSCLPTSQICKPPFLPPSPSLSLSLSLIHNAVCSSGDAPSAPKQQSVRPHDALRCG